MRGLHQPGTAIPKAHDLQLSSRSCLMMMQSVTPSLNLKTEGYTCLTARAILTHAFAWKRYLPATT